MFQEVSQAVSFLSGGSVDSFQRFRFFAAMPRQYGTLPETNSNIAPENGWLEY